MSIIPYTPFSPDVVVQPADFEASLMAMPQNEVYQMKFSPIDELSVASGFEKFFKPNLFANGIFCLAIRREQQIRKASCINDINFRLSSKRGPSYPVHLLGGLSLAAGYIAPDQIEYALLQDQFIESSIGSSHHPSGKGKRLVFELDTDRRFNGRRAPFHRIVTPPLHGYAPQVSPSEN